MADNIITLPCFEARAHSTIKIGPRLRDALIARLFDLAFAFGDATTPAERSEIEDHFEALLQLLHIYEGEAPVRQ